MSDSPLVSQIKDAIKAAMRARDKERLGTLRLIQSEFKRIEVDERVAIDDTRALVVLDKMVKQRRDSAQQYLDAGRNELAEREEREIAIIQEFLPQPLTDAEIAAIVDAAIADTGASGMQGMGAVMAEVKPRVQGRADMGAVSKIVKARLAG